MKRIAIASFAISIISFIMVLFLYMPKFKNQPAIETSDVYLKKIIELYPELQGAVFIDSTQYNLYKIGSTWPTHFFSILNNISIVGYHENDHLGFGDLRYEFYNSKTEILYTITFKKELSNKRINNETDSTVRANFINNTNDFKLAEIATYIQRQMDIEKEILGKDTLVEISDRRGDVYRRFYSLKKANGDISKIVEFDWGYDNELNKIGIYRDDEFKVNIATKFNSDLKLSTPAFEGKTIELNINYKDKEYKTTAILSDAEDEPSYCRPESYMLNSCSFKLIAPFENCNLKIRVHYDTFKKNSPFIDIENDITQLMQCLNIW